jgi:branched-chain amino acid transport system permease protein
VLDRVGVLFGIPSLRIKGLYLAVATLAAQFFCDWAFLRIKWFTNDSSSGSVSVAGLNVLGWKIDTPAEKYLFCLGFLVVFAVLAKNLVRSHIGREWMAIRDMDVAASVIGIRPVYAKLTAFAVSSASSSAWPARCGASCTWARGSRRPSTSTARSSCCSW